MSETTTDREVYEGAVNRVRRGRDQALNLADTVIRRLLDAADERGNVGPIESLDIEEWREQLERLARVASKSDAWFHEQHTATS